MSDFGLPLTYFEWSVAEGSDLDDPATLRAANPSMSVGRITEEYTYGVERALLTPEEFARERFGIFDEDVITQIIPPKVWAALAATGERIVGPKVFAIDIDSPDGEIASARWATIAACGASSEGPPLGAVIEHRQGTAWIVPRLVELRDQPLAVMLDPRNTGSLQTDLENAGFTVIKDDRPDRDAKLSLISSGRYGQACGQFYDTVIEGAFRHLDQPELNRALTAAKKRSMGDAWAWARKTTDTDISPLVAVTLALYGFGRYGNIDTASVYEGKDLMVL